MYIHILHNTSDSLQFANPLIDEIRALPYDNKFYQELSEIETNLNTLLSQREISTDIMLREETLTTALEKVNALMHKLKKQKAIDEINASRGIIVVDALMGTGKTTFIFDLLNSQMLDNVTDNIIELGEAGVYTKKDMQKIQIESTKQRFICVVPTLDECDRYKEAIPFFEKFDPKNFDKKGRYISKLDNFKDLIKRNKNIVTTHALIKMLDADALELIRNADYTLIIDEELNVIEQFTGLPQKDFETLVDQKYITVDDNGFLAWRENDDNRRSKFDDVKRLCQLNSLMLYTQKKSAKQIFIWNFPYVFFSLFKKCYIATYMWNGSIQKAYFDLHKIKYHHKTLHDNTLINYDATLEDEQRKKAKELINIYEGSLNDIGNPIKNDRGRHKNTLNKSWYDDELKKYKKDKERQVEDGNVRQGNLIKLGNTIDNYFKNIVNAKNETIMWTVYGFETEDDRTKGRVKEMKKILQRKGYKNDDCFAPCNCKGTNKYGNRYNLAYLIDFHIKPPIFNFFKHNNIAVDEDLYSLSFLLQWIWRSRIRNNQSINLFIPSERMRTLLVKWLNNDT